MALGDEALERAAGRWQAYAHHLAPVLPVLAPYGEAFGYAQA